MTAATATEGYIFQTGGTLRILSTSERNTLGRGDGTGLDSYGYLSLEDGEFRVDDELWVGYGAVGIIEQTGGLFYHGGRMYFGTCNGLEPGVALAVYNISAGVSHHASYGRLGHKNNGIANINISGTGHVNFAAYPIIGYSAGSLGVINIGAIGAGGGMFTCDRLDTSSGSGVVNFHGGTMQAGTNYANFVETSNNTFIYGEGGTIDTQAYTITIPDSLDAPTGLGVTGITVTAPGAGYISPPGVKITGGSGTYATGYATVAGGAVTGIVVTNPGVNFAYDDVLNVELAGGGGAGATATITTVAGVGCELAANSSGSLTKTGAGTLRLTGVSTYTGATNVTAGSLIIGGTTAPIYGSVGASSGINVAGGALLGGVTDPALTEPVVTLATGATMNPGDTGEAAYAKATFETAGLALGDKSILVFALDNVTPASDQIVVPGAGTVDSSGGPVTVKVNFEEVTLAAVPSTFTLIDTPAAANLNPSALITWKTPYDASGTTPATLTTISLAENLGDLDVTFSAPTRWWTGGTAAPPPSNPTDWMVATNWVGAVPTTGADAAFFTPAGAAFPNVDLTANVTLSSINFSDPATAYTIGSIGGFKITLNSSIAVNSQILDVSGAVNNITCDIDTVAAQDPIVNVTQATGVVNITGVVGGLGMITKRGPGLLYLGNTGNTYAGPTVLEEGTLQVDSLASGASSSLGNNGPAPANLVLDGGTLLYGGIAATADRGLTVGGTSGGVEESTISTIVALTLTGEFASTVGGNRLVKAGSGALTLTYPGDMTISPHYLHVNDGTLALNGGAGTTYTTLQGTRVGYEAATAGTLNVDSGALDTTRVYIGVVDNSTGTINVNGGDLISRSDDIVLGNSVNSMGTLNVTSGTVYCQDQFYLGLGAGAAGIVNQSGGTVTVHDGDWLRCGSADAPGFGYYKLTGGELNSYGVMAGNGGNDLGIIEQSAGTMNVGSSIRVSSSSDATGLFNLTGGTANIGSYMNAGGTGSTGCWGQVNVSGTGTELNLGTYLMVGGHANTRGYFNLGTGGTVTMQYADTAPSLESFFNFHGGTLKPNENNSDFMQLPASAGGIFIGCEGGAIDTDGFDIEITEPLQHMTGYGLDTIDIDDGGSGYDAPPIVQISGGSGWGATAIAEISGGGAVSDIVITNPGTGYDSEDTDDITVTLLRGGYSTIATVLSVSLAENCATDGGLEKDGLGKLTLSDVSTYTGDTTVLKGTLCIAATGQIGVAGATTTVKNGATLGGDGTIVGTVLGEAGSTINPGCSIGELTVDGNADINGTLLIEYDGGTETIDVLTVIGTTGDLDIADATINFSDFTGGTETLDEPVYVLANYVTLTGEETATATNVPPGYTVDYHYNGYGGNQIALVPEPSTLVLLLMGLIGLAAYMRRRR